MVMDRNGKRGGEKDEECQQGQREGTVKERYCNNLKNNTVIPIYPEDYRGRERYWTAENIASRSFIAHSWRKN